MPCPDTGYAINILLIAIAKVLNVPGCEDLDLAKCAKGNMPEAIERVVNKPILPENVSQQALGAVIVLTSTAEGLLASDPHDLGDMLRLVAVDEVRRSLAIIHRDKHGFSPERSSVELVVGVAQDRVN